MTFKFHSDGGKVNDIVKIRSRLNEIISLIALKLDGELVKIGDGNCFSFCGGPCLSLGQSAC